MYHYYHVIHLIASINFFFFFLFSSFVLPMGDQYSFWLNCLLSHGISLLSHSSHSSQPPFIYFGRWTVSFHSFTLFGLSSNTQSKKRFSIPSFHYNLHILQVLFLLHTYSYISVPLNAIFSYPSLKHWQNKDAFLLPHPTLITFNPHFHHSYLSYTQQLFFSPTVKPTNECFIGFGPVSWNK